MTYLLLLFCERSWRAIC